ncbi:MAG: sce7726 family protein [Prolixibacteraceae bacterium]|nr:sce7726 family protein [Prolixibacteraceae bacterium]
MKKQIAHGQKEKMRSYASIFSSTSFARLLKNEDFDFINKKIERYDSNKIGKNFTTYSEYIRYAYNSLKKEYRCEYVYKNELINELLLKKYGTENTVVINEFKVGNSVADMVLFNGTSKAFEIKTELDSEKRLNGQLNDYAKIFKECYIVTHESLIEKYLETDVKIGVIAIVKHNNSFKMEEVRKAAISEDIDASVLIKSLRTQEYKNIVIAYFGQLPCVSNFQMFDECAFLMQQIPHSELHRLFITELKKRASNTQLLQSFYKELRQLCLSLKINQRDYQSLSLKLSQPIKL